MNPTVIDAQIYVTQSFCSASCGSDSKDNRLLKCLKRIMMNHDYELCMSFQLFSKYLISCSWGFQWVCSWQHFGCQCPPLFPVHGGEYHRIQKKNTHNSKSTLRTKDFRPSSACKKLVAAFLWSAKGEMS